MAWLVALRVGTPKRLQISALDGSYFVPWQFLRCSFLRLGGTLMFFSSPMAFERKDREIGCFLGITTAGASQSLGAFSAGGNLGTRREGARDAASPRPFS